MNADTNAMATQFRKVQNNNNMMKIKKCVLLIMLQTFKLLLVLIALLNLRIIFI